MIPGEILHPAEPVVINARSDPVRMVVTNAGDRPVQVGSHYHFAEANPALIFDQDKAWGHRLGIPAGTSMRFEPGVDVEVELVALGGRRIVPGLRGVAGGALDRAAPPGG